MSNNIQEINKKDNSLSWRELRLLLKKKINLFQQSFYMMIWEVNFFEKISNTEEYYLTRTEKNIK